MTALRSASDEIVLREVRAENRRRVVRTIRTIVGVIVILAAAFGAMWWWMTRPTDFDGPFCVWATPVGGTTPAPTVPGVGAAAPAPTFGDVRATPGGEAARGNWVFSVSNVKSGAGCTSVPTLHDVSRRMSDGLFSAGWNATYHASRVQRTSPDGKVWTAFLLDALLERERLVPAPDAACAGMWEVDIDGGPLTRIFDLLPSGGVRGRDTRSWAVHGGVLVIAEEAVPQHPRQLYVGVLSDDRQSCIGRHGSFETFRGEKSGE